MARSERRQGVSPELDDLSSTLMGEAFDALAEDGSLDVLLVVQDEEGRVASWSFGDDGVEACLSGARAMVRSLAEGRGTDEAGVGRPVRYALVYPGAVADEDGAFRDAVILEFGERGYEAYSASSLVSGVGRGDDFAWTEPAPAGEVEPLL